MRTRQRRRDHPRRRLFAEALLATFFATMPLNSMATGLDADDLPTAVVRVDNIAPVSAENLRFAEARATEVFVRAGAHVRWMDEDSAVRERIRPPYTIVLVSGEENARAPLLIADALGFADPQVHRAHVFCDRIEVVSARSRRSPASILGDVMAHELGHLLLPPPGHSTGGIMRSNVDTRLQAIETFTRAQAREIVLRLRQGP